MNIDQENIIFPITLNVTEQEIDISFLTEKQKQFYFVLFQEIIDFYNKKQKPRVVIGFAGPSGSGKSVVVEILKNLAKQLDLPFKIESVGIDAYSYPNTFLCNHFDGEKTLKDYKGRFDTYDVLKLKNDLENFKSNQKVSLPIYSRKIHDPIENSIELIEGNTLLLVEGLWLLSDKNKWNEIGDLLDFTFFVSADKDKVREGTIKRHMRGGRTQEEASDYYDNVDATNFDLVIDTNSKANKIIPSYYEI